MVYGVVMFGIECVLNRGFDAFLHFLVSFIVVLVRTQSLTSAHQILYVHLILKK